VAVPGTESAAGAEFGEVSDAVILNAFFADGLAAVIDSTERRP